jgi:cell division protein FtsL
VYDRRAPFALPKVMKLKALGASDRRRSEVVANPRARSAIMRVAQEDASGAGMTRLNLVLLLAVLASALYLVNVQYESRRLFTELDRAKSRGATPGAENERLQVEKRAQATPCTGGALAREKLQMRWPPGHHHLCHLYRRRLPRNWRSRRQRVRPIARASGSRNEPQHRLHLQPFAGQPHPGMAQQVHRGGHCAGLCRPGCACGLHPGHGQ